MFNNMANEWEVVNTEGHQPTTNLQVMEATVDSNKGKYLESAEISFNKMKITNNMKICNKSGTISENNVCGIFV